MLFRCKSSVLSVVVTFAAWVTASLCGGSLRAQEVGLPCVYERILGELAISSIINDLAVVDQVVLAAQDDGLAVYSVTDPAQPAFLRLLPSSYDRIHLLNETLVLMEGNTDDFYDLTDPANPQLIASHTFNFYFNDYVLLDNYLYANISNKLTLYDASDLTALQQIAVFPDISCTHLEAENNKLLTSNTDGLHVWDISDRLQPEAQGSIHIFPDYPDYDSYFQELILDGDTAFVAWGLGPSSGFLEVISIADPFSPVSINRPGVSNVQDMWLDNGKLCVTDRFEMHSVELDEKNGVYEITSSIPIFGVSPTNVVLTGDHAVMCWSGNILQVSDVSPIGDPLVSVYDRYNNGVFNAHCAVKLGDVGYFAQDARSTISGIQVVDLTDLNNVTQIGTLGELDKSVNWLHIYRDHLIAACRDQFDIYSLADPLNPELVSSTPVISTFFQHVETIGDLLFLSSSGGDWAMRGLHIYDIADLSTPQPIGLLGNLGSSFKPWKSRVHDGLAYVASAGDAFHIVDVSDPSQPSIVAEHPVPGGPVWSLDLDYPYLFLNLWDDGLLILDITDPLNPIEVSTLEVPGSGHGIALYGSHAYLSSHSHVNMVDISDPANPELDGVHVSGGEAEDTFVYGDYAYIADWDSGFEIVNISSMCDKPPCLPDTNDDGILSPSDFTAWINAFNNQLPQCDQNRDGQCSPSDFTAWIANFNAGC